MFHANLRRVLFLGAIAAFACGTVSAQEVLTQKTISLDLAQLVARAAIEKCRADGYHISVTVVDTDGLVKIALRDDGTSPKR